MAAGVHGSARTTPRVRAKLQSSQEATRALAVQYRLNPKTVSKWRKRTTTADQPMGPSRPRSTVLTETEEAIILGSSPRTFVPAPHPTPTRRRSGVPAREHPKALAQCTAPLPGSARHLSAA